MLKKILLATAVIGLLGLLTHPAWARHDGPPRQHHAIHRGWHHGPMHGHGPHFGHHARPWGAKPYRPYRPPYTYVRPLPYHARPSLYPYPYPYIGFGYSRPGVSLYFGW